MNPFRLFLAGLVALTMTSCAMKETTTLVEDTAYLVFHNAERGMVFQLDGGSPQSLLTSPGEVRYEIAPGKHTLTVSDDGTVLLERVFFLSTGQVFEISIPNQ